MPSAAATTPTIRDHCPVCDAASLFVTTAGRIVCMAPKCNRTLDRAVRQVVRHALQMEHAAASVAILAIARATTMEEVEAAIEGAVRYVKAGPMP